VIDLELLERHAFGELSADEAASVDEHILACGGCAATLERLLLLGDAVSALVRAGTVTLAVTAELSEALARAGLLSRSYRVAPGRSVACTVTAEDIYALTTLEADLARVERVDLLSHFPSGETRVEDIPFDAGAGLVRFIWRSDHLRALPSARIRLELVAVAPSGGERRLGEYLLDHSR
jgi:hypothetical protein